MIQYELIPTVSLLPNGAQLRSQSLPELVHLEDPALAVMTDFTSSAPHTIHVDESMDDALNEMKLHGVHFLLAVDSDKRVQGIIATEDLLGAKPIQILQERRISRDLLQVKMLMVPVDKLEAFEIDSLNAMRVGNVVNTLKELKTHYALVVKTEDDQVQHVRGLFNTSQISKQLHRDITTSIAKAESVSELSKRHD